MFDLQPFPLGAVGDKAPEGLVEFLDDGRPVVPLGHAKPSLHGLCEGPEGHAFNVGESPSAMPPHACGQPVGVLLELRGQA